MKKKVLLMLVMGILTVGVAGCMMPTTSGTNQTVTSNETEEPETKEIVQGDTIATENRSITINDVSLLYDVMPDEKGVFYTHYAADEGQVYIAVDFSIKNLAKQNLDCDKIMQVKADYNDGYQYKGFAVVEDDTTGFTYASITSIDPLETKEMKYLIECPQEVEETENPLFLIFKIENQEYKYVIR